MTEISFTFFFDKILFPSEKIDTLCLLVQRIVEENKVSFLFEAQISKNALVRSDHKHMIWIAGAEERDHGGGGPVREAEGGQRGARHPQHCLQEAGGGAD